VTLQMYCTTEEKAMFLEAQAGGGGAPMKSRPVKRDSIDKEVSHASVNKPRKAVVLIWSS
jgi:hypothetical protein